MNKLLVRITFLIMTAQCFSVALENLVIPKGVVMPYLPKSAKLKPEHKPANVSKKMQAKNRMDFELPPKRIISKATLRQEIYSLTIKSKPRLNDTSHVAVLLKNNGYRLYKKRTLEKSKHWYYWLKSSSGAPLFKVELIRSGEGNDHALSQIQLWSWDDKEQINLDGRQQLVAIFGQIV